MISKRKLANVWTFKSTRRALREDWLKLEFAKGVSHEKQTRIVASAGIDFCRRGPGRRQCVTL